MFSDHQVRKQAYLDWKIKILPSRPMDSQVPSRPMILVKNWNFPLRLLLNKMGLKIMFADYPVRKQAYLYWKIRILPSRPMEIFSKG